MSECKLYYLLSIFESPYKKWENTKTNKSKKIQNNNNNKNIYVAVRQDAGAPKNGQKLVEEVKKCKDWNLTVYRWLMRALLTKKTQF